MHLTTLSFTDNEPVSYINLLADGVVGQKRFENGAATDYYYLKDHLGSTRVILRDNDGTAQVSATNDYYPFGLTLRETGPATAAMRKFQFIGKERDAETGLDYFGARYYDSEIGRWFGVDPLANEYAGWSPYNYGLNNPQKYIDPDGEFAFLAAAIPLLKAAAIGGAIGAGIDYSFQVSGNLIEGKGWSSFTDIDPVSMGVSAGAGAVTGGTGAGVTRTGLTAAQKFAAGAAVKGAASAAGQQIMEGEINPIYVGVDAIGGQVVGTKFTQGSAQKLGSSAKAKLLAKKAIRAQKKVKSKTKKALSRSKRSNKKMSSL